MKTQSQIPTDGVKTRSQTKDPTHRAKALNLKNKTKQRYDKRKGVMGYRTTSEKEAKASGLKTSALVQAPRHRKAPSSDSEVREHFRRIFSEALKEIPTYRPPLYEAPEKKDPPATPVATPKKDDATPDKTPHKVYTPDGGTVLNIHSHYRDVVIYSNQAPSPSLSRQLSFTHDAETVLADEKHPFYESKFYETVAEPTTSVKEQAVTFTKKELDEVDKENIKNNHRRCRNQNQVMAENGPSKNASATKYMQATGLAPAYAKYEWLHLIAHSLLGKLAQISDNLVLGRNHSNTDMMFIEYCLHYVAEKYPAGFTLDVKATLIERTQIGKEIEYKLITPDFEINLLFDAHNPVKPTIIANAYMQAYVKSIIETLQGPIPPLPSANVPLKKHAIFKSAPKPKIPTDPSQLTTQDPLKLVK